MITVWVSYYTAYGEQNMAILEVEGKDIYNEIRELLSQDDEIADYGIY